MSKIQAISFEKLNNQEFINRLENIEIGLQNGRMWMNDRCEMQVKDGRLVRFFKSILNVILPLKLYASIKVDRVASSYFDFLKANQEHLTNPVLIDRALKIIDALNEKTQSKYQSKLKDISKNISDITQNLPQTKSQIVIENLPQAIPQNAPKITNQDASQVISQNPPQDEIENAVQNIPLPPPSDENYEMLVKQRENLLMVKNALEDLKKAYLSGTKPPDLDISKLHLDVLPDEIRYVPYTD